MPGTTTRTKLWAGLATVLAAALPAQEITWAGLPALAESAPATKASRWLAEAAQERRGGLGRSYQPRLSAGVFGQARASDQDAASWPSAPMGTAWPEAQAGLDWNLWRGGRDHAAGRAADAAARAALLEAAEARADLLLTMRRKFLAADLLRRKLEILAEASGQTQEDLAKARKKAIAGLNSRTDVSEFELRLLSLEKERAGLEDELDQELAALATTAGIRQVELGAGDAAWPEKQAALGGAGLEEAILSSNAEAEMGEAGAQGRWPLPELGLGLGLAQGGENGGFMQQQDYRAKAGLSFSLWDGGDAASARKSFEKSARSFEILAAAAKGIRESSADLVMRRFERWTALRPKLERRVEASGEFRKNVIQEYLKGVRDGRDLEEATKAAQEAKNDLEEARVTAWTAWSEFQRLAATE